MSETVEVRDAAETHNPGRDTAWMSWLRVIAICGVVTIHTVGYNATRPNARDTMRGELAIYLDLGAIFAVPVFVMLSGAMLLDPARFTGNAQFLRKRALRLLPPVVFWHLWYVALIVVVKDQELTLEQGLGRVLSGNLYTALYFFWIVLGLSIAAPVLIPFIRESGRKGALVAGVVASAIPALTLATMKLRGVNIGFVETTFSWWFPYLGLFLLGFALRSVVLRGIPLWITTAVAVGLGLLHGWQWRNPAAPVWLNEYSPVAYYSVAGICFSVAVYLAFHGLVAPGGPLRFATRPRAVRLGRILGDATLGVFALHLTVLHFVHRAGVGGPNLWSPTTHDMGLRLGVVLVLTWALVLVLRRVPVVRALL